MAYTDDIAHRLAELLKPVLPGFQYVKSRTEFRKNCENVADVVGIDVNTRGGASYSIAFHVGVVHSAVELLIAEVEGRKASSYDKTIYQYSPNVGKQDVLPFGGAVWWWGLPQHPNFSTIENELRGFITGFALPYCERFHDVMTVRKSLETRDGLSLNMLPFKQVLSIDTVFDDLEHVESYLALLQREIDSGYHHDLAQFNSFYASLRSRFGRLFPDFELNPKTKA
jgi:hypothetical protein